MLTEIAKKGAIVPDNMRLHVISKRVPHYIKFERLVFNIASNYAKNYDGGYWDYYLIPDDATLAMTLDDSDLYNVANHDNQFYGTLNGYEFGIACSLFAYSHLMHNTTDSTQEYYIDRYYTIRDHAISLSKKVVQFID